MAAILLVKSSLCVVDELHHPSPSHGITCLCNMRHAIACQQCRKGKRKCMPSAGQPRHCKPCMQRQLPCSWNAPSTHHLKPLLPAAKAQLSLEDASRPTCISTSDGDSSLVAVTPDTRDELLDIYLRLIHHKPHTLFHPPTLKQRAREGTLPPAVLYAIYGMAARFSTYENVRSRVPFFLQHAKTCLKRHIDEINVDNIQACILTGNLCGADDGDFSHAESLFFGIAIRMAVILRLDKVDPRDDATTQEVKRRTWWTLHMIDCWSSAGLNLPRQLVSSDEAFDRIRLPMHEGDFERFPVVGSSTIDTAYEAGKSTANSTTTTTIRSISESTTAPSTGTASPGHEIDQYRPGLWAYMVSLVKPFTAIQDLHQNHVSGAITDLEAEQATQGIAQQLSHFEATLPSNLKLSLQTLQAHADQGLGQAFVALHLGYHHYSALLYFQYLDTVHLNGAMPSSDCAATSPSNTDTMSPDTQAEQPMHSVFAARCRQHAATLSDLLRHSMDIPGCEAVYFIVGHMTVVSSAVLLYTLLFGDEAELSDTRRRLELNFQKLMELKAYWPRVDIMMDRLFAFQNMCMWSANPNTHKVDKWMVKFLLQHAVPITDNYDTLQHASGHVWQKFEGRDRLARETLSMLL